MTKSTGVGRGGARAGSGRKKKWGGFRANAGRKPVGLISQKALGHIHRAVDLGVDTQIVSAIFEISQDTLAKIVEVRTLIGIIEGTTLENKPKKAERSKIDRPPSPRFDKFMKRWDHLRSDEPEPSSSDCIEAEYRRH